MHEKVSLFPIKGAKGGGWRDIIIYVSLGLKKQTQNGFLFPYFMVASPLPDEIGFASAIKVMHKKDIQRRRWVHRWVRDIWETWTDGEVGVCTGNRVGTGWEVG